MKRLPFIWVAWAAPLLIWSCEGKIEWDLDVEVDVDVESNVSIRMGGEVNPVQVESTLNYEEIMPLTSSDGAQGGDCWGDYFFQFSSNNRLVRVFDLSLKKMVQTIYIPEAQRGGISDCHCNVVCFGTEYYDAEDPFPLIYVSTGYASEDGHAGALAYRITQDQGKFSVTLVQTIRLKTGSWTEFIPAGDFAYICHTGPRIIYKVKMPRWKDGDVVLDPKSAIGSYQFTAQQFSSRNQDRSLYQGRIVVASGVPASQEKSVLIVLNLEERERERIYNFKESGLEKESESIFVWRGELCVAFLDRIVRLIL